jgi:hypothetical protein
MIRALLFGAALLLGAAPASAADNNRIVKALMRISKTRIPHKKVACEITGATITQKDDSVVYRKVTVGDFLASYNNWALLYQATHRQSLKCKGKRVLNCEWWYGEKPNRKNPGWQTFLKFRFDEKKGRVPPASLECLQVP